MRIWDLGALMPVLVLALMTQGALAEARGWHLIDPGEADSTRRITTQSTDALACGMFTPRPAALSITCLEGTLSVAVETGCNLAPLGGQAADVTYRLDQGGPQMRRFALIGGGRSLQLAESEAASAFTDELLTAGALTVTIDAANKVPAAATFLLPGLEAALADLLQRCGG